ncbi:MAG: vWA domain-containing protein [Tepidisphaerales bacterium]
MAQQVPFSDTIDVEVRTSDLVDNPEPRVPLVLVLDKSGSMAGEPIRQLNEGLVAFKQATDKDELARKRVDVTIVQFGPVEVTGDFVTVNQFTPPTLKAGGDTPLGAAILKAIELIDQRKQVYRTNGLAYYRPWIFLVTDGAPTDAWAAARERIREGEEAKKFIFLAVGVEGADFSVLNQLLHKREPVKLRGYAFEAMFQWLSASMSTISASQVDEKVQLPPIGWSVVD